MKPTSVASFIDTNVLVYAEAGDDPIRQARALQLLRELKRSGEGVISTQLELAASRAGRGLCQQRCERELRARLRRCLDEGDDPGPLRPVLIRRKPHGKPKGTRDAPRGRVPAEPRGSARSTNPKKGLDAGLLQRIDLAALAVVGQAFDCRLSLEGCDGEARHQRAALTRASVVQRACSTLVFPAAALPSRLLSVHQ